GISGAYCALTSTSGIFGTPSNGRGAASQHDADNRDDYQAEDRVLRIPEAVVEAVVALPDTPTDAGQGEAPDRRAHERQHGVRPERCAEDAGGNGDERADDRSQPAEEDRPSLPAVEPALGVVEPLRREVQPPPAALEQG